MTYELDRTVKDLIQAMKESNNRNQPSPFDAQAKVVRVDGDIAWVHLPGGVDETPVKLTLNAKEGDAVQVRISGGRAWLTGNSTRPPTDDTKANEVESITRESVKYIGALKANSITADSLRVANAYIQNLVADNITTENLVATTGYIQDLVSDNITAQNIVADHATVGNLDVNYAKINAANVTDLSVQNAWVNKLMVQTGLLAHEGAIFSLDAIQVNASNITAGTIDVNRLIITDDSVTPPQKYLINFNTTYSVSSDTSVVPGKIYYTYDSTTGTYSSVANPTGNPSTIPYYEQSISPSPEKMDGNIVEPRTITADKIVAHDITVQEITTENLVGTNGWINLNQGKFFYGDGTTWANTTTGIMWDGTNLRIKGEVNVSGGNVYTKAETNSAVDSVEVGGTNLVPDSKLMGKWTLGTNGKKVTYDYDLHKIQIRTTGTTENWSGYFETKETRPIDDFDGGEYTLSFEYKSGAAALISVNLDGNSVPPYDETLARTKYCSIFPQATLPSTSSKWVKKSVTFRFNSDFTGTRANGDTITINGSGDVNSWTLAFYNRTDNVNVYFRHVKLEKGNKATSWSPNPSDGYSGGGDNLLKGADLLANGSGGWSAGHWRVSGGDYGTVAYSASITGSPSKDTSKGAVITKTAAGGNVTGICQDNVPLMKGYVTFSVWVKGENGGEVSFQPFWYSNIPVPYSHSVKTTGSWQFIAITAYCDSTESMSAAYIYYKSISAGGTCSVVAPKLEYGTVVTDGLENYRNYITKIDNAGLRIHPTVTENDRVQIDGTHGVQVYRNDVKRAQFDSNIELYDDQAVRRIFAGQYDNGNYGVLIGKPDKARVSIIDSNIQMYDTNGIQRINLMGSGVLVGQIGSGKYRTLMTDSDFQVLYQYDGTTSHTYKMASFGATAVIGRADGTNRNIEVTNNGVNFRKGTTTIFSAKAAGTGTGDGLIYVDTNAKFTGITGDNDSLRLECITWNVSSGSVESNNYISMTKNLTNFGNNMMLLDNKGIFATAISGNSYSAFVPRNSNGDLIVGYGNYNNQNGGTYVYGKDVYLRTRGVIQGNVAYTTSSDERLKKDFKPLTDLERFFMTLNPIAFKWNCKEQDSKTHFGMKAQEVEKAFAMSGLESDAYGVVNKGQVFEDDRTEYKSLAYSEFIPLCIHMIQKQQREIEELKGRLA